MGKAGRQLFLLINKLLLNFFSYLFQDGMTPLMRTVQGNNREYFDVLFEVCDIANTPLPPDFRQVKNFIFRSIMLIICDLHLFFK